MRKINITIDSIPQELQKDIKSKIFYIAPGIENIEFIDIDKKIIVTLDNQDISEQKIIADVNLVIKRITAKNLFKPKIIEDKLNRHTIDNQDPLDYLIANRMLKKEGQGIYILGDFLSKLFHFFDNSFVDIAKKCNAEFFKFPSLISPSLLERVNYFKSFPHSLSFVFHLNEDLKCIQDFSQRACCDQQGLLNLDRGSLVGPKYLLSPAVCFHLYKYLENQKLKELKIVTSIGKCFRYESGNMIGLDRLWDFSMREIIFVGDKDKVLERREYTMKLISEFINEMEFAYSIEKATDPFFIDDFVLQSSFQSAFDLKYEIRMMLPYKSETLAVGSFNFHQNFFGKAFNIKTQDNQHACTGCTAFGLERWVYAFLAQFGFDINKWPERIRLEFT